MKICIDAGHSTNHTNPGIAANYVESAKMWELHLLLVEELKKYEDILMCSAEFVNFSSIPQNSDNVIIGCGYCE